MRFQLPRSTQPMLWFAIALLAAPSVSHAAMTPTAAATTRGFTVSTFVYNVPNVSTVGPLGVAYRIDGKVLVTTATGTIRIYPSHASMQTVPTTIVGPFGTSNTQCLAQVQQSGVWKYYMSQDPLGRVVEIDQDGVILQTIVNLPGALCLVPYPAQIVNTHTGHLFATAEGSSNVFEIDPIAKTITTFVTNAGTNPDGLTFSADGATLYVACYGNFQVRGFSIATSALVWSSPATVPPARPDGLAIGEGTLSGYLYANCNEGVIWEFGLPGGPHAGEVNLIATGGSRGDFIAADPAIYCGSLGHPSLLLSQTDRMIRLDPPGGGFFAGPTSDLAAVGPSSAALPPGPGDPPGGAGATPAPALGWVGMLLAALLLLGTGAFVLSRNKPSAA
jgi:hypothetical protein